MSLAISLPFSFNVNGGVSYTSSQQKILQDRVVLVVMTLLGERVMRPTYGTNARGVVFENTDAAITMAKQQIGVGFSKWLPYLKLLRVDSSVDSDNTLNLVIQYNYGVSSNPETVTIKTAILNQAGDIITEVPYGNQ